MPTHSALSINKTILFLIFICIALVISLFVFHKNQPPSPSALSSNDGTIFPLAREIKSFDLTTANNRSFTQKDFNGHWTLLFFGFTHCSNVCPTTLDMLNRAYVKLHQTYPNLQVVLISLDPERDTPEKLFTYTHSFNQDFIGATGKIEELRKLQSQFGIFSARDATGSQNDYQLQHTASIMLINPNGKWAGVFRYGMSPLQFTKAFTDGIS